MNINLKKNILIIAAAAGAIFVTFFVIFLLKGEEFKFISSNPKIGEVVSADTKQVTFTFNSTLDATVVPVITTYPTTSLTTTIDKNTLTAVFSNGLQEDKDYSVLIKNIQSIKGKMIDTLSITFYSEDRSPAALLKRVCPIEQSDFSLNYDYSKKQFFVIARISNKSILETQVNNIFQKYNLKSSDYNVEYQFSNSANSKLNPNFNPQIEEYTGDGTPPPF